MIGSRHLYTAKLTGHFANPLVIGCDDEVRKALNQVQKRFDRLLRAEVRDELGSDEEISHEILAVGGRTHAIAYVSMESGEEVIVQALKCQRVRWNRLDKGTFAAGLECLRQ